MSKGVGSGNRKKKFYRVSRPIKNCWMKPEFSLCRWLLLFITGFSETCSEKKPGSEAGKKKIGNCRNKKSTELLPPKSPLPYQLPILIHFTNALYSVKSLLFKCDCLGTRGRRDAGRFPRWQCPGKWQKGVGRIWVGSVKNRAHIFHKVGFSALAEGPKVAGSAISTETSHPEFWGWGKSSI